MRNRPSLELDHAVGEQAAGGEADTSALTGYVLAVDGGGTKTDVVAVGLDGVVLAHRRGASSNPQLLGVGPALALIDELASSIVEELQPLSVLQTNIYLSGLDTPEEIEALTLAAGQRPWVAPHPVIDNDLFALLRAGTSAPNAVAVVIGTGINAVGVREDGATARFSALGTISGDWGGGSFLGAQAIWHAARSEDGRGPRTLLQQTVPAAFGLPDVRAVTLELHFQRLPTHRISELSPVLFAAADAGDTIAIEAVRRQGEEVVAMVGSLLTRLELTKSAVPVVLGGGVLAADHPLLMDGIRAGLERVAPRATIQLVTQPPIIGSVLLALESAGIRDAQVLATVRHR